MTLVGDERHAPYERPPLSKEADAGRRLSPKTIADEPRRWPAAGIAFHPSTHGAGDRPGAQARRLAGRGALPYDKLLLATGATPRRLHVPGADGSHCVYLRTLDDALHIRGHLQPGSRIAIIGGGFIGLELAAAARQLGATVTVIEVLPRLLSRGVPAEIAADHRGRHRAPA